MALAADSCPASPLPIPLSWLARSLGTRPLTLIEHVEPWLFARGFVRATPGGRVAVGAARRGGWGPHRDARRGRTGGQITGCRAPNVRQTIAAAVASP